jgi:DNA-binding FrmR family transcriptional regulator
MKKDIKKRAVHRLKIIEGQIQGLLKMVKDDKYCINVLNQSLAVQESLKSLDALLLENHFNTCVRERINKKGQAQKTIKELLKVYKLARKK